MKIRPALASDGPDLIRLITGFRSDLARLRGRKAAADEREAAAELAEYRTRRYPIFVADSEGRGMAGYLVCRVDGNVVWAESLYTDPAFRRQGIGSDLYSEAERLAADLGGDAPYNWIDPDNEAMIGFLLQHGYRVLNLIELRRPRPGERVASTIAVGSHEFDR